MLTDMNIYKLTVFLEFETKKRQNLITNESFVAVTQVAEIHAWTSLRDKGSYSMAI